jgi:hypothetical protein
MRRMLLVASILVGLAPVVVQPGVGHPQTSLVGSWQLTMISNDPATTPPIPVVGLANFNSDGGAIATAGAILAGPPAATSTTPGTGNPALGNWNGGPIPGHAVFKLVSLITNADGSLAATRTFQAEVTPQSEEAQFSGSYSFSIADPLNNLIISGSGTITGTQIPHFLPPASTR